MSQIWNTPWETKIMISTFSPLQLLTVVTSIAEVSLLNYTKWRRLKNLTAHAADQTLQRGQVLDLQVVCRDVAVLYCATVEFSEEFLEHVVDADPCQNVTLLNVAVQRIWDETFVAGKWGEEGIKTECINIFVNTIKHCAAVCILVVGVVFFGNNQKAVLPDFMGSSGQRHFLVHGVVSDCKHSHAQTLVFYLMLLCLWLGAPEWNYASLKVILALCNKYTFILSR